MKFYPESESNFRMCLSGTRLCHPLHICGIFTIFTGLELNNLLLLSKSLVIFLTAFILVIYFCSKFYLYSLFLHIKICVINQVVNYFLAFLLFNGKPNLDFVDSVV